MADPIGLVWKSFKDFKSNLVVLVPTLIALGLLLLLAVFIAVQFLAGFLLFRGASLSAGVAAYAIFFFIIDFALLIAINSYTLSMQYGVMGDAVVKGKSSLSRMLQHGRYYFRKMLTFTIAKFIILYVPLAVLALLAFLAYVASPIAGFAVAAVFMLLYVLFFIVFSVLTVFNLPILIRQKIGGFQVIAEAFRYAKANLSHVIITVAIVIVLWLLVSFIATLVGAPYYVVDFMLRLGVDVTSGLLGLYFISSVLSSIASWLGGIFIAFFIFNSYFNKNKL